MAVSKPNPLLVAGLAAGALVVLGGVVFGVDQAFRQMLAQEVGSKVLAAPNSQLRQLRSEEDQRLTHFQWADSKKGIVRVPIERGMELTLRDWQNRPTAPVPVDVAQGAAPAAAAPKPAEASKSADSPKAAQPGAGTGP